jgi:hypothetical protein
MKTFAFVPTVPGLVHEVFVGDQMFEVHEDIAVLWYEAPSGTKVGDQFDGSNWVSATPQSPVGAPSRINQIKSDLANIDLKKIRAMTDAMLTQDLSRLQALEAEQVSLRAELKQLES